MTQGESPVRDRAQGEPGGGSTESEVSVRPLNAGLRVEDLSVRYPTTGVAVRHLSFDVEPGEAVAILGPNGAGKTTTVRAVTGFLSSERAHIQATTIAFDGRSIKRASPHQIARQGIAVISERDKVFRHLRVKENLQLVGGHRRDRRGLLDLLYGTFPILKERSNQTAGLLSGGQLQMLSISMAVLQRPTFLVADEMSLGLAPALLDEIVESVIIIRQQLSLTMLIVEQNVGVALQLCRRGIVLDNGERRAAGPLSELMRDQSLAETYLGGAR